MTLSKWLVLFALLVPVWTGVTAQQPTDLQARWDSAVRSIRFAANLERDSIAAQNVQIRRATGFRCFDCPLVRVTLLIRNSDSVLVTASKHLPKAWRLLGFAPTLASSEFHDHVV